MCVGFISVNGIEKYISANSIDEFIDTLLLANDIEFINKFVHQFSNSLSEEHFLRLDDVVLNSYDSDVITRYAILRTSSNRVMDFIDVLIRQKSWSNVLKLSEKFNGFCFDKFDKVEDAIIENAEPRFVFYFL